MGSELAKKNIQGVNGKQVPVSDTGSRHENIRIFPSKKEHGGELNWSHLRIASSSYEKRRSDDFVNNLSLISLTDCAMLSEAFAFIAL